MFILILHDFSQGSWIWGMFHDFKWFVTLLSQFSINEHLMCCFLCRRGWNWATLEINRLYSQNYNNFARIKMVKLFSCFEWWNLRAFIKLEYVSYFTCNFWYLRWIRHFSFVWKEFKDEIKVYNLSSFIFYCVISLSLSKLIFSLWVFG